MSSYDRMRGLFSDRPVAFHPQLARLLGGINAALLFQQIAFWSNTKPDSAPGLGAWIWKTQAELESETALTRYEQEGARRHLRRRGVMQENRRGVPARLHYRIDWRRFFEIIEDEPSPPECGKPPDKRAEGSPTGSPGYHKPERGPLADRSGEKAQSFAESVLRESSETEEEPKRKVPGPTEAEGAWLEVASALIEAGKAPPWFRPWCRGAELTEATLTVSLPTSRKIGGETFADLTRRQLQAELTEAWRAVSGYPEAVLRLDESS